MSTPPASFKNKGISRVRPAVVRPQSSSGFAPSFPALDEDPAGVQMEGWLALEDESSALIQRYGMQRRVVLVLGRTSFPSCCVQLVIRLCFSLRFDLPLWTLPDPLSLDFTEPSLSAISLLVETSPQATLLLLPKGSFGTPPKSPRVVILKTSAPEAGLGKVFEEAIGHGIKWKKACPTRRPQSWMGSASSRRNSWMGPPTSPSLASPSKSDRPVDVVFHYLSDEYITTQEPDLTSGFRMSKPKRRTSVDFQGLLSASFLATSASLPFLATRSSSGLSTPSHSSLRRPPTAVLAGSRRGSDASFSMTGEVATSGLHLSATIRGSLASPPDAVMVHILPPHTPPLLPQLLDNFMQTFLAKTASVLMAVMPESLLDTTPTLLHDPPLSPDAPQLTRVPPTILQLLLNSCVRPPLPPLPSIGRSRRGSSSSIQSLRSGASGSARPLENLLTYIGHPAAITFLASVSVPPSPLTSLLPPPALRASASHLPAVDSRLPDLVVSSSSSSASDDTSLQAPPSNASPSLDQKDSFSSISTATDGGADKKRLKKKPSFWDRLFRLNLDKASLRREGEPAAI